MIEYNTPVLTSKYVIKNNSEIIYVAHHQDGIWEFWGKENIDESEILVASWGQIISIDSSILQIASLPIGFSALREGINSQWKIVSKN